ncbi:type VII secretion-associated serine protease mycosin [Streptomyces sp. NPDC050610]|uniref:type VII secretion-associated serine protease mycosin n=1 Tax=Streptomyces sp. NPDC050610 TaxID=3157097 RepID=UPI003437B688
MRSRGRTRATWLTRGVAGGLGVLLLGLAASPASAESVRSDEWHLDAMHADEMWQSSKGQGVTVAVIDTGVNPTLGDLEGQVLRGKDFSGKPGDERTDYDRHGTSIASLIAGTGKGKGAFGLAPEAKILPVRVSDFKGSENAADAYAKFSKSLSAGIRYAADSEAKVINISLAAEEVTPDLGEAVKYARDKGKLIFAGVGNTGDKGNPVMYPAATPGVVGVGAVDKNLRITAESERGPQVDLVAPGDEIVQACDGGTEICTGHGTSASTALASASAALVWAKHPDWTANQVTRVLLNTAGGPANGPKRNDSIGYGMVRPRIVLKNPGDPGPADVDPLAGPGAKTPVPSQSAAAGAKAPEQVAADAPSGDGDGNTALWLGVGGGAVVVVAAVVAAVMVGRRRRA